VTTNNNNNIIMITTIIKKKLKKRSEYDLAIEISRMWKVGTKIVPVINGASGIIKNGLVQNRQLLPG
jgi:hypothetical protein